MCGRRGTCRRPGKQNCRHIHNSRHRGSDPHQLTLGWPWSWVELSGTGIRESEDPIRSRALGNMGANGGLKLQVVRDIRWWWCQAEGPSQGTALRKKEPESPTAVSHLPSADLLFPICSFLYSFSLLPVRSLPFSIHSTCFYGCRVHEEAAIGGRSGAGGQRKWYVLYYNTMQISPTMIRFT